MKLTKYLIISILVGIVLISNSFISGAAITTEKNFIIKDEQFINSDTKISIIEDTQYQKEYILVEKHGKGYLAITPRLTNEENNQGTDQNDLNNDSK